MGSIKYEVPLIKQAGSPICLFACAAMVMSERLGCSVGISRFTNGFDPNNTRLEYGVEGDDLTRLMYRWGFNRAAINPTNDEIEQMLQTCGPFILSFETTDIPIYGVYPPDPKKKPGYHAVVVTGFDSTLTVGGICWINNPWGQKDLPVPSGVIINAVTRYQADGTRGAYYYEQNA